VERAPPRGASIALRWRNTGSIVDYQWLVVRSARLRLDLRPGGPVPLPLHDTTIAVPRFNNAAGQVTVLTSRTRRAGTGTSQRLLLEYRGHLLGSSTFSPAEEPHRWTLGLSAASSSDRTAGTITIAHDGGYGNVAAKSVALDVATGFSFDTPGLYKPL
jgi:hypothetical protein